MQVRRPLWNLLPSRWQAGLFYMVLLGSTSDQVPSSSIFPPGLSSSKSASGHETRLGGLLPLPTCYSFCFEFSPDWRGLTPTCLSFLIFLMAAACCGLSPLPEAHERLLLLGLRRGPLMFHDDFILDLWLPIISAPSSIFSLVTDCLSCKIFCCLLPWNSQNGFCEGENWAALQLFPLHFVFHCRHFGGRLLSNKAGCSCRPSYILSE